MPVLRLAAAVVGVAGLFLPATLRPAGPAALIAWCYHGAAGLLLLLALRPLASPSSGGVAAVAGMVFGAPVQRALRWCYIVGVTAGQAVVATVGGHLVAAAASAPWVQLPATLVILAGAAVATAGGWRAPAWVSPAGFAAVIACILAGSTVALSGAGAAAFSWPQLAVIAVFAFVGWESVLRLAAPPVWAVAAAAGAVAAIYLSAATLPHDGTAGPAGRALMALAAIVCAVACQRNVAMVADLAVADRAGVEATATGRGRTRAVVAGACALVAAGGAVLIGQERISVFSVLLIPGAMGLAVFVTAALAGAHAGRGWARACALLAAAAYLTLLPFAGYPAWLAVILFVLAFAVSGGRHALVLPRFLRRLPRRSERSG
ncbi:hypothetical protein ABT297_17620 [Dactylosporangium sp. NPDC000555]|uniref:hypothetical protein n=1 Tax=Dactylosporangium sp. NPDC000555 TaxID=3154260 RepID=UPI00331A9646